MSADKHTDGPWAWGTFHKLMVVPVIDGHPYKHAPICVVPSDGFPHDEETIANVMLLAAAPRLLAALDALHRRYVQAIGNEGPEAAEARRAMAEARGIQS